MFLRYFIGGLLLSALVGCTKPSTDYAAFKNSQSYEVPLWEDTYPNKKALFVFPHPDDEIVCAGTIAYLKSQGWSIALLTLTNGQPEEKTVRGHEWKKAVVSLNIDSPELYDLPNNPWDSVLANKITFWYDHADSVERMVLRAITRYKPQLLFSYDSALGGYGHPEHRITAKAVYNVFSRFQADSTFTPKRLLQITLTRDLERLMLGDAEVYKNAKRLTGNSSLPEPTLAFDISKCWNQKRKAALCYTSQAGTLRRFKLLPEPEDTVQHYSSFDREYFFEIGRKQ